MSRSTSSGGFSLPEMIVVVTLTGIILAATYSVLVTNQRTYTVQNAQIQSQQTVRAALEVLSSELREVGVDGGDILAMDEHSIRVKALRKWGYTCDTTLVNGSRIFVMPVGDAFASTDTLFVFADNNQNMWQDDVWLETNSTGIGTYTCLNGDAGQYINVNLTTAQLMADSVRVGAPVRSYVTYDYYVDTWDEDGRWYLFRERRGVAQPLVGPLRGADGVSFVYLDQRGNVTATPADVEQIRVTVATLSPIRQADGTRLRDSLVAVVHTRN